MRTKAVHRKAIFFSARHRACLCVVQTTRLPKKEADFPLHAAPL
jgi:hypothetical protein